MDITDAAPPRPHHLSDYSTYIDFNDYREDLQVDREEGPMFDRLNGVEVEADRAVGVALGGMEMQGVATACSFCHRL